MVLLYTHPDQQIEEAKKKYMCPATYRRFEMMVRANGDREYVIEEEGMACIESLCETAPELDCEAEMRSGARRLAIRRITAGRLNRRQKNMSITMGRRMLPARDAPPEGYERPSLFELENRRQDDMVAAKHSSFMEFSRNLDDHF